MERGWIKKKTAKENKSLWVVGERKLNAIFKELPKTEYENWKADWNKQWYQPTVICLHQEVNRVQKKEKKGEQALETYHVTICKVDGMRDRYK